MTIQRVRLALLAIVLTSSVAFANAADITGKWTASFETQIGKQDYVHGFVVKDSTLTGKVKSNLGSGDVLEGKVDGDKVSFVEMLKFQDMEIGITYTGTIESNNAMKGTLDIGGLAQGTFTGKRQ